MWDWDLNSKKKTGELFKHKEGSLRLLLSSPDLVRKSLFLKFPGRRRDYIEEKVFWKSLSFSYQREFLILGFISFPVLEFFLWKNQKQPI